MVNGKSQGINSNGIDIVLSEYSGSIIRRVDIVWLTLIWVNTARSMQDQCALVNEIFLMTTPPNLLVKLVFGIREEEDSAGIISWMCPTNESQRYNLTSSLIGWAHTQNEPCSGINHLSFVDQYGGWAARMLSYPCDCLFAMSNRFTKPSSHSLESLLLWNRIRLIHSSNISYDNFYCQQLSPAVTILLHMWEE